jgi:hypothetical protein
MADAVDDSVQDPTVPNFSPVTSTQHGWGKLTDQDTAVRGDGMQRGNRLMHAWTVGSRYR